MDHEEPVIFVEGIYPGDSITIEREDDGTFIFSAEDTGGGRSARFTAEDLHIVLRTLNFDVPSIDNCASVILSRYPGQSPMLTLDIDGWGFIGTIISEQDLDDIKNFVERHRLES